MRSSYTKDMDKYREKSINKKDCTAQIESNRMCWKLNLINALMILKLSSISRPFSKRLGGSWKHLLRVPLKMLSPEAVLQRISSLSIPLQSSPTVVVKQSSKV